MSNALALEQFKKFIQELQNNGYHLGMEPEFTVIETLVIKDGREKVIFFRENLDRFWEKQRGLMVLEKLRNKAEEQKLAMVAQGLDQLLNEIGQLFTGQFLYYPPERFSFLPHTTMLQTMAQIFNEYDTDKLFRYIDQHLEEFDGHFYVILGATMRNARSTGADFEIEFFEHLGRVIAQKRLEAKLPCSFAYLYGV